jgi:hypothetical protein
MRTISLVAITFAALSLSTLGARADGTWCAHYNTGLNECNFNSFRQCMVSVSGVGGVCLQNQFENPYWTGGGCAQALSAGLLGAPASPCRDCAFLSPTSEA